MPKPSARVPSYRRHKASGQARVIVNGKHIYLGAYGSTESREKYARLIAQISVEPRVTSESLQDASSAEHVSVNEVILAYWRHAEEYYVKDDKPTKELACVRDALHPLKELCGMTTAADFGPKSLKLVRQHMITLGWSRGVINSHVGRIKRVFKWAVAEELIPPSVHHGLQSVTGLRRGRTMARETEPIKPVPDLHVGLVLPFVSPQIAAMIKLQRLTGMRSGEMTIMRPCDIDMTDDVWLYELDEHKRSEEHTSELQSP